MRMTWTMVAVAGVSVLVLAGTGCRRRSQGDAGPAAAAVKVQTITLAPQTVPEFAEVVGTVRPRVVATVAAKVLATIEAVRIKAGDTVQAGDELARLDDRELRTEFERAQADYERYETLLARAAATRAEFETVQAKFRTAETALSHARITAPFAGLVTAKQCEAGDLATPGRPLFTIEQPGAFRLEAAVPERFGGAVAVGQKLEVQVEAAPACAGVVGEIQPAADPASRSILIKIELTCAQPLQSGRFGRAQVPVGQRSVLAVPAAAVQERGQLTSVFVAEQGRARLRLVKTGRATAGRVEILAGLEPGDQVITGHDGALADGGPVDAVPAR